MQFYHNKLIHGVSKFGFFDHCENIMKKVII